MDNESINFAIDVANSVLFQIAADNNCNKVVRYGHKKRTVKFYEGRKLILLVQIIRCTVIHEDQTEEHHYHELLPDILLPFLQYTAASFMTFYKTQVSQKFFSSIANNIKVSSGEK